MKQPGRDTRVRRQVVKKAQAMASTVGCAFSITFKTVNSTLRSKGAMFAFALLFIPLSVLLSVFNSKKLRIKVSTVALLLFLLLVAPLLPLTSQISPLKSPVATAATSNQLNFQGRLLTATGGLVADGEYNVEFKLYYVATAGTAQWTETRLVSGTGVTVQNGYFSVYLGDQTAFPALDWSQDLYLGMNIGGTGAASWDGEMTPRFKLTSVPYAFKAANVASSSVDSADSDDVSITTGDTTTSGISGNLTVDTGNGATSNGTISVGTTNASSLLMGNASSTLTLTGNTSSTFVLNGVTVSAAEFNVLDNGIEAGDLITQGTATDEYCLTSETTAGALLEWQACGAGSSLFTDGGTFTYLTDATEDLAVGGITQAAAKLFVDVSASNLYVGQVDTTNGTITFNVDNGTETEPTISSNTTGDLAITAPSGSVIVGSGTGEIQITPDATSAVTIGNSAGTGNIDIGIGTGAQAINLGTGGTGAKTLTVGSTAGTSTTVIQSGTGNINLQNTVLIGTISTTAGTLRLADANGQYTQFVAGDSAGNLSFTLPTTIGSANQCLANSGTAGILTFAACVSASGDNITVNSSAATDANFLNTTATASVAGTTFALNTASNPDDITLTVSDASGTLSGVITANAQTIGGAKTFNSLITGSAGLTITGNTSLSTTAGNTTTIGNATGLLALTGSAGNIFNFNGVTIDDTELNVLDNGIELGDLVTQGTATDEFCLTSETGGGALLAWQACGAGSSLFSQGTGFAYLTSTTDDFVLGATTVADGTFYVDVSTGSVRFGSTGTTDVAGSLVIADANGQTTTLSAGDSAGDLAFILPTTIGSANQCVKNSGTAGTLEFSNCNNGSGNGGSQTLQDTYTAGTAGDQVIALSTANDSVIFRNPASAGTDSGYVLNVDQLNTGAVDGLRVSNFGTGNGQTISLTNTAGTQAAGLSIDRNGAAGTTTSLLSLSQTAGTATNGILFTGTIGTDITTATDRALTISANGTGGLTLGSSTATNTVNIANANTATGNTQTINIGAGTPAGTGLTNINIGNLLNTGTVTVKSGSGNINLQNTVLIGTVSTTAGTLRLADANGQYTQFVAGDSAGNLSFILPTTIGSANECLQNSGTAGTLTFAACGAGGSGDSITVNSTAATDANFLNTTATASVAGTTFAINTVSNPDDITLTVSDASGTLSGVITANAQTIGGAKTFNSLITGSAGLTITGNTSLSTTAGNTTTIGNATGLLTLTGSAGNIFNFNGVTIDDTELNVLDNGIEAGDLITQGTATDEFCLTSETGGGALLAWQACGAGSSLFTDGGTFTYLTDAAEDLAVGGITQAAAKLFVDVSASNLYVGQVDTTNGTITFNVDNGTETEPTISSNTTGDLAITAPTGTVVVGSGTGNIALTPDATSTVTIGNSAGTGAINIGVGTGAQALNFGTGGTGAKTVTVGSTASTGTTTIQAGSGGIILAGFNCTGFTNSGAITADASGVLSCSNDDGGAGSGDNITVNSTAATDANFLNTTATASVAGTTFAINTASTPDDITLTVSDASGTLSGVITANAQTIGGAKTFNSLITGQAGLTITGAAISLNDSSNFAVSIAGGNSTGTVNIGTGTGIQALNFGTGGTGAKTVTLGSTASTGVTTINSGTGNIILQSAGGAAIGRIQIGAGGAGSTTPDFLALDVKSDTGDPAGGAEGYIYYNTLDNKFRCYQDTGWTDCIGAGGSGDAITVNTTAATDANFLNTTATAAVAGTTWSLNTASNPDDITLAVSDASGTVSGVVTANAQTFGGNKTFNGTLTVANITPTASLTIGTVDATGSAFILDTKNVTGDAGVATVNGAMYYNSADNKFRCYQNSAWTDCIGAGGGGGGGTVVAKLIPEFAGGTISADGSSNSGSMTADYDTTNRHSYYDWSTTQATVQDYDVLARYQVPSDYTGGMATDSNYKFFIYDSDGSTTTAKVTWSMVDAAGNTCFSSDFNGATASTWEQKSATGLGLGSCTFAANDIITFRFKMIATTGSGAIRVGEVQLQYTN